MKVIKPFGPQDLRLVDAPDPSTFFGKVCDFDEAVLKILIQMPV